jgi:hypothetical protein
MDPTALFPDIGHLKEVRVEAHGAAGIPISGLMHSWRTGRYHDPVNAQILNIVLDPVLTGIRTHILIVSGNGHMGKSPGKNRDLLNIDRGRNIDSAMTDINADLHKSNPNGIMEYWV